MGIVNKFDTLLRTITGNCRKLGFYYNYYLNKEIGGSNKNRCESLIVSLTSYGERVEKSAPLAIYSIMKQSLLPSEIVLWIDKNRWNDNNLPKAIKYLQKNGLTVQFCTDIRSYTKLVPSLKEYPDKCIVTVDDDVYYSSSMLEELYECHKMNKDAICSLHFCIVKLNKEGNIAPYDEWEECHVVPENQNIENKLIFPQGYGGVLYPPHVFDSSVFEMDIAKEMCPTADDVWFYCMGIKNGVQKAYPFNSKTKYYLVDMFRQALKKDRLNEANVQVEDNNSVQLKKVLAHYKIEI